MRIDIVRDEVALAALRPEWDTLWTGNSGRFEESFHFAWSSWATVQRGAGAELATATVRDESGELVLVLPMTTRRRARLVQQLVPLGPMAADGLVVVGGGGDTTTFERAWDALVAATRADVSSMPVLRVGSPIHSLVGSRRGAEVTDELPIALATLGSEIDWPTYAASLGKYSGRNPGRRLRRLEREGVVTRRQMSPSDDDFSSTIAWMFEQKRVWGAKTGKSAPWLSSPSYQAFMTAVVTGSDGAAPGAILVIELDGQLVAAQVMGLGRTVAMGVMSAFADEYASLRVGTVCWEYAMEWTLERGLDFDLGVGHEDLKVYYSKGNVVPTQNLRVPHTRVGRLAMRLTDRRGDPPPNSDH